jgi:polyisoprenoid-binding protein YceI
MARYTFEPRQSRFTVQAFSGGMLRMFAHNPTLAIRDFDGELNFSPEDSSKASLHLSAKSNSLDLTDDVSAKDRHEIQTVAKDQVLEAARYPEVTFQSNEVSTAGNGNAFRVHFKGNLSLHGANKPQDVDAQVTVLGDTVRLSGATTLRPSDYGIKPVKAAGGAITTKDEVKLAFDIVGRKRDEQGSA